MTLLLLMFNLLIYQEQDRQHGEGAGQSFHGETSLFVFGAFEQQRRARGNGRDAEQQKNATAVDRKSVV